MQDSGLMIVCKHVAVYVQRKTNVKLFSDRFDDNVCVYIKVDTDTDNVQLKSSFIPIRLYVLPKQTVMMLLPIFLYVETLSGLSSL